VGTVRSVVPPHHQVGGARDTEHVGDGEQHVGHDLRVVRLPVKPRYVAHISLTNIITSVWALLSKMSHLRFYRAIFLSDFIAQ